MSGIITTGVVARVPTLARAEITTDVPITQVEGERRIGEMLRTLKPGLWVTVSKHWVSIFNWFVTQQPEHNAGRAPVPKCRSATPRIFRQ